MPSEWHLHYWRWIIEDGGPDRRIGETFSWFAVELRSYESLTNSNENQVSAAPVNDYSYKVIAQVTYLSERSCIVDCGLRSIMSRDQLPENCRVGDFVAGTVALELPLCVELVPEQELRSLRCKWYVNSITADLTPYVSRPDSPRYYYRDATRVSFGDVTDTSEVRAHDYILHCVRVGDRE